VLELIVKYEDLREAKRFVAFNCTKELTGESVKKIAAHDQTLHITCAIKILKPTGDSQYKMYQ